MGRVSIEIADHRQAFEPGEEFVAIAGWEFDASPAAIEVRLTWFTVGKGTRDLGVVHTERIESPAPRGQQQLRLPLPCGPYSFSGRLISILWAVEIVAQPSGDSARKDFTLGPRGQEVVVTEVV